MEEFWKIAESGELESMYNRGKMYEYGDGVEKSLEESLKWYKANIKLHEKIPFGGRLPSAKYYEQTAAKRFELAEKGSTSDIFAVGIMYLNGYGVEKNFDKARYYFEKAAALNVKYAMIFLGEMYEKGFGVEKNLDKAREYYENVAASGKGMTDTAEAILKLAEMYEEGNGVTKNLETARDFYKRAAAILNANVIGIFAVFTGAFANPQNAPRFFIEKYNWLEDAANLGDSFAMLLLGNLYRNGYEGVEQNYKKAVEFYEKSAALGNTEAMCLLGSMYGFGKGVPKNPQKKLELYEKAAALGDNEAMYNLGIFYENGEDVPQDYQKAREWYEKAATFGNTDAMDSLGEMYEDGIGVEKNHEKAQELYDLSCAINEVEGIEDDEDCD